MIKDRIIRHMNADHQDSLVHYLRHYTKASASEAATAQLIDINTAGMTITRVTEPNGPPRPVVVPIEPPMQSLGEARERLVAMSHESLEGLGLSRWKVEKYPLPTLTGLVYAVVSCTLLAMLLFPDQTLPPGAEARQLFLFDSDKAARFLYRYQREGRSIIMGTAVFHAAVRMRRRLKRHCYASSWPVWVTWLIVALLEGPIACRSFDRTVRAIESSSGHRVR
ncbi:50S ribosomal protein L3 [Ceratobasidium sp. AG-Ba]|nr:50S ribosomal protein L3 [Ceratobasidium sp. AG-Ba]